MKSPIPGMPNLVPVAPSKPVRLQLNPRQFMLLYATLTQLRENIESLPPGKYRDRTYDAVDEIVDLMDDKLDFKTAE